jgi:hypothetical protein
VQQDSALIERRTSVLVLQHESRHGSIPIGVAPQVLEEPFAAPSGGLRKVLGFEGVTFSCHQECLAGIEFQGVGIRFGEQRYADALDTRQA